MNVTRFIEIVTSICILFCKRQTYKINMRKFTILCILIFCVSAIDANSTITVRKTITWDDNPVLHNPTGKFETRIWSFDGAVYDGAYPSLPVFSDRHIVNSYGIANVELV